jgi:hypothetical protein
MFSDGRTCYASLLLLYLGARHEADRLWLRWILSRFVRTIDVKDLRSPTVDDSGDLAYSSSSDSQDATRMPYV